MMGCSDGGARTSFPSFAFFMGGGLCVRGTGTGKEIFRRYIG